jgi:hypothetical protein
MPLSDFFIALQIINETILLSDVDKTTAQRGKREGKLSLNWENF